MAGIQINNDCGIPPVIMELKLIYPYMYSLFLRLKQLLSLTVYGILFLQSFLVNVLDDVLVNSGNQGYMRLQKTSLFGSENATFCVYMPLSILVRSVTKRDKE